MRLLEPPRRQRPPARFFSHQRAAEFLAIIVVVGSLAVVWKACW